MECKKDHKFPGSDPCQRTSGHWLLHIYPSGGAPQSLVSYSMIFMCYTEKQVAFGIENSPSDDGWSCLVRFVPAPATHIYVLWIHRIQRIRGQMAGAAPCARGRLTTSFRRKTKCGPAAAGFTIPILIGMRLILSMDNEHSQFYYSSHWLMIQVGQGNFLTELWLADSVWCWQKYCQLVKC